MINYKVYFPGIVGYKDVFNNSFLSFLEICNDIKWDEMKTGTENDYPIIQNKTRRGKNVSMSSLLKNSNFVNFKNKIDNQTSECILDYSKKYGYWDLSEEGWVILKYDKGDFFKLHTDSSRKYVRQVSSVYYLNSNYEGGELYFPFLNIIIKPEASELIVFPSTNLFSHEARPIIEGTKYSMANWYN